MIRDVGIAKWTGEARWGINGINGGSCTGKPVPLQPKTKKDNVTCTVRVEYTRVNSDPSSAFLSVGGYWLKLVCGRVAMMPGRRRRALVADPADAAHGNTNVVRDRATCIG